MNLIATSLIQTDLPHAGKIDHHTHSPTCNPGTKGSPVQKNRIAALIFCFLYPSAIFATEDNPLKELITQLDSTNPREKISAVRILGEIGPPAAETVPSLLQLLKEKDAGLRYETVIALGRIDADAGQVVPQLCSVLADDVPAIQHAAIDALRRFGSDADEALSQLHNLLKNETPLISVSAARAIVEIAGTNYPKKSSATSVLLSSLQSPRRDIAVEALNGLAVIGSSIIPDIRDLLDSREPQVVCNACDAIAAIDPKDPGTIAQLSELAKSAPNPIRWHAINALGEAGADAKDAVSVLIDCLSDPDAHVRFSAEQSLHRMGDSALPALIASLKDENSQRNSAAILGGMGPKASSAVKPLTQLLHSQDPGTRREAIFALASISTDDADAIAPELIQTLQDKRFPYPASAAYALGRLRVKTAANALKAALTEHKDPLVSLAIACALIEIDPHNEENATLALPHVRVATQNPQPEIRREAAIALGRVGRHAKEIVPLLKQGLSDKDPTVRRQCLVALAEYGPESAAAIPDIIKTLGHGRPDIRSVACYALGRIGISSDTALDSLTRLLHSRDAHERTLAAWALVRISPDEETKRIAMPFLAAALHGDNNPQLRLQVAETLGEIGRNSTLAKEALEAALKDSDESVRQAASKALNSIE
jgi:HEAT repeat protein